MKSVADMCYLPHEKLRTFIRECKVKEALVKNRIDPSKLPKTLFKYLRTLLGNEDVMLDLTTLILEAKLTGNQVKEIVEDINSCHSSAERQLKFRQWKCSDEIAEQKAKSGGKIVRRTRTNAEKTVTALKAVLNLVDGRSIRKLGIGVANRDKFKELRDEVVVALERL